MRHGAIKKRAASWPPPRRRYNRLRYNHSSGPRKDTPMPSKRWEKIGLPSRHVTVGHGRAPHRSYYYEMGLTEDEIDQPLVGVAT